MNEILIKSSTKGERGKKVCGGCGNSVGVRTAKCSCGFNFTNKKLIPKVNDSISVVEVAKPIERESVPYFFRPIDKPKPKGTDGITLAPSGVAPFKLEDFSVEGIKAWGRKVINEIYKGNKYGLFSVKALIHWTTYHYNSSDLGKRNTRDLIAQTLNELANEMNNENA